MSATLFCVWRVFHEMKKSYEAPELNVTVFSTSNDILLGSEDKDVIVDGGDLWGDE